MEWALIGRRVLRRVLRRGSKKGLSRRHLEGRSTSFREYDPLGMRPTFGGFKGYISSCLGSKTLIRYHSGSFARGRCTRGRSEIPHFRSKLLLFALVL